MVSSCSFCGEQYGVTEDVTFHKFPANEERRKKWLVAVQRGTWLPGKSSMLCSKHFSQDKFVYKISGDKIRRYLMPDTVPTIFDRSVGKSNKGLESSSKASNSVEKNYPARNAVSSNSGSNLQIPASTLKPLEPNSVSAQLDLIGMEKKNANVIESIKSPVSTIPTADTVSNFEKSGLGNYPRSTERTYNTVQIQTDFTWLQKQSHQAYAGDLEQLNAKNVFESSRKWAIQNDCLKKMRTNMKVLRQRNRRLEKRVTDLKSVVKFLKNRIVARDSEAVRLCGHTDLPVTKERMPERMDRLNNRVSDPLEDHNYITAKNKFTL